MFFQLCLANGLKVEISIKAAVLVALLLITTA